MGFGGVIGFLLLVVVVVAVVLPFGCDGRQHDYRLALNKGLLFFEAQRSGYLPSTQRVTWRSHSGLKDGKTSGVDLVGGYYDAGDNVKFGLPMAFTITMMSWSVVEYWKEIAASGELGHAMDAVKWGTDYLLKAHPQPNVLYGQVGDGHTDHYCWQRPEDMTTSRTSYRIDAQHPGSDLAGETAAAMAAASLVFKRSNPSYSAKLLTHSKQLFQFADKYRGKYDSSITVAQKFYRSHSGYADELLWAAAWLYKATNDRYYLSYLVNNGESLGGTGWAISQFSWDVKYAGVQVLAAKFLMERKHHGHNAVVLAKYEQKAEYFLCSCLGKGLKNVKRTPGGLLFHQRWNNLQFVTSASFLLTVYSDYLTSVGRTLRCPTGRVTPSDILGFVRSQVDYILGNNPRGTSYMVGYGNNYPRQVHHRGSSIVSIKFNPAFVSCRGGYNTWYQRKESDPNLLVGAIVGGPDAYDNFVDVRNNYEQTEPATYNNAPMIGVLARLAGGRSGHNQLFLPAMVSDPVIDKKPLLMQNPRPSSHLTGRTTAASPITIEQNLTSSWMSEGIEYYRYSTILSNNSPKTLTDLHLRITDLYGPVWGLEKSGNLYRFPSWINKLAAGESLVFVYIHPSSQANIQVERYTLA